MEQSDILKKNYDEEEDQVKRSNNIEQLVNNNKINEGKNNAKGNATKYNTLQCIICDKRFADQLTLIEHIIIHKDENEFKCDIEGCGKSYTSKDSLVRHIKTHKNEKPYACNICLKTFSRSDNFSRHKKIHSQSSLVDSQSKPNKKRKIVDTISHPHHQQLGDLDFNINKKDDDDDDDDDDDYENHRICNKNQKKVVPQNDGTKVNATKSTTFTCKTCHQDFVNQHTLNRHLLIHQNNQVFKCDFDGCDKSYKRHDGLLRHLKTHGEEKPYECKLCLKSFYRTDCLSRHKKTHHNSRSPIKSNKKRKIIDTISHPQSSVIPSKKRKIIDTISHPHHHQQQQQQ